MPRALRTACLAVLGAVAAGSLGCTPGGLVPRAPATGTSLPPSLERARAKAEARARRIENLEGRLHPTVRALVERHHGATKWARDGILVLPGEACAGVVEASSEFGQKCSLIALAEGATALLVLGDPRYCHRNACLERSWVFLRAGTLPVPLPTRRRYDYRGLRADVAPEQATALWMAGFRGYQEGGSTLASADHADASDAPERLDYASCAVAADEHELVCRSTRGTLVALQLAPALRDPSAPATPALSGPT